MEINLKYIQYVLMELIDINQIFEGNEGNILSMWSQTNIWYKRGINETTDHAYQCSKVQHILGTSHVLYEEAATSCMRKQPCPV